MTTALSVDAAVTCAPTQPLPVFAAVLAAPDPPPFTAADADGPAYVMPPCREDRVRVTLSRPAKPPRVHPEYRDQYRQWLEQPIAWPPAPCGRVDAAATLVGLLVGAVLVAVVALAVVL